jgi:DNA mismatch repair ATPase MutL
MSDLKRMAQDAEIYARKEIEKYGLPSMFHFDLSLQKGLWLAEKMNANTDLVKAGISFMDLKLGEAFKNGVQKEHVKMSSEATQEFLSHYDLDEKEKEILINSVEAHHGSINYNSIEAEICANADCYRFVHPKGVFYYFTTLSKRYSDFESIINQIETKLNEKINIASIPIVKEELSSYYNTLIDYINLCR